MWLTCPNASRSRQRISISFSCVISAAEAGGGVTGRLRLRERGVGEPLDEERRLARRRAGGVDRLLRDRDRVARESREPRGYLERPLERFAFLYDFGDDSGPPRLVGAEPLGEQEQLLRSRRPEQPRHPVQPAGAGQDSERDLGEAEDGALVRNPEVECERELERAAEAVAVNGRDGRLRESGELFVDA